MITLDIRTRAAPGLAAFAPNRPNHPTARASPVTAASPDHLRFLIRAEQSKPERSWQRIGSVSMTDGGAREDRDGLAAGASSGQPGGRLDDLITAVALGDERAYAVMYDQSASWLLGAALRVLRDPAQAEEVMQEVLLEVWRTASRFDRSQGSGISWLMTIAHRRAVDRVRSERS